MRIAVFAIDRGESHVDDPVIAQALRSSAITQSEFETSLIESFGSIIRQPLTSDLDREMDHGPFCIVRLFEVG